MARAAAQSAAVCRTDKMPSVNELKRKISELAVSANPTQMVQYIAEMGLREVPAEFVQPPEHRPSTTQTQSIPTTIQIPVIDMSDFHCAEGSSRVVAEIGRACEEWGFFQVINHGVPEALMQEAMQMCREFFALPMQEKELYSMKTSSGIGYGRRFAVKEGAKVDWVDRLGFWSATEEHRKRQPLHIRRPASFK